MASSPNFVIRDLTAFRVRLGRYHDSTLWKDASDVNGFLSGPGESTKPESAVEGLGGDIGGIRKIAEEWYLDMQTDCAGRVRCRVQSPAIRAFMFRNSNKKFTRCQ